MADCLTKPAFHIVLLLVLALAVSACGRRGALEAPGTVQTQEVQTQETSDINDGLQIPGTQTPEPAQEEVKEDKPFFLDPLL